MHTQEMMKTLPESSFIPRKAGKIQRKQRGKNEQDEDCPRCSKKSLNLKRNSTNMAEQSSVPPIVHEVLNSPGQSLDPDTRAFMEPRFGHDFSKVRVHTDEKGAESAKAVNAMAYTVGQDIVFDTGRYEPNTQIGRNLLIHELVHTVQQKSGSYMGFGSMQRGREDEQEAESNEKVISQGLPFLSIHPQPMQISRRGNDADAGTAQPSDAGVRTTQPSDAGTSLFRDNQVACIIRLGGCASSRSGGKPTPNEIKSYNQSCRSESTYTGPDITPSDKECANSPRPSSIPSALVFARSLATRYPNWLSILPSCPCTDSQARANPSMWEGPNACMSRYHPGAASGYRSARGYASVPGTNHGQQCCYDAKGALITEGGAAGTPDTVAPIGLWGIIDHYFDDVMTFDSLGWEIYNQYWVPNQGNNCPANRKP